MKSIANWSNVFMHEQQATRDSYRHLYDTARWKKRRRYQLQLHPLCELCKAKGLTVAAEVVHHVEAHKGDPVLFHTGKLQSLCKPCHDHITQQVERFGYSRTIGVDGWPTDNEHPVYKQKTAARGGSS